MAIERLTLPAAVVALGLALAGLLAGNGFARARAGDRYVTVKGVAEREAKADLAIWPLRVVGADNDLSTANSKMATSIAGVRQFLARHGIDTSQVQLTNFSVNDAYAEQYGSDRKPTNRYVIHQTMLVRSNQPDRVLAASQQVSELAAIGVAISSGNGEYGGGGGPTFIFSGLNTLKPTMIADATARAREAAEQFARDSRSQLGGIRQANQGVFEILPRDQAPGISQESQIAKVVRVVATIDYYLK
ncbi:MAG TPA: SIMPL domain-containing protein [Gemmatimonadaceae bacterium]|nr:SIMPL domain-containing protein [Gemmatimonadaceae bacterium]